MLNGRIIVQYLLKNWAKVPVLYNSKGSLAKFAKNDSERILYFYNFSDAYTCSYVVEQV